MLASSVSAACTTWTSLHGGYGFTPQAERSVAGIEIRRAVGPELHAGYWVAGARAAASDDQFDAEAHLGAMRPLRLSDALTFVPSATFELARVSNVNGHWSGGALGPALGAELVWWTRTERRVHEDPPLFGCLPGVPGAECSRRCLVEDADRHGLGARVSAEYDMRLTPSYPRMNDWIVWLTLSATLAESESERRCCYDADERPRRGCTLAP